MWAELLKWWAVIRYEWILIDGTVCIVAAVLFVERRFFWPWWDKRHPPALQREADLPWRNHLKRLPKNLK